MQTREMTPKEAGRSVTQFRDETSRKLLAERRDVIDAIALNPLSGFEVGEDRQASDYASANQLRDVEYSHREALSRRLHQLDEALERVRLGAYGVCTECGAHIVDSRLAVDPAAALCVGCQTAFERSTL